MLEEESTRVNGREADDRDGRGSVCGVRYCSRSDAGMRWLVLGEAIARNVSGWGLQKVRRVGYKKGRGGKERMLRRA